MSASASAFDIDEGSAVNVQSTFHRDFEIQLQEFFLIGKVKDSNKRCNLHFLKL